MADASFDVVIVGTGPGGYVAAIRASQLGLKTAVVERERLGGICLNWGCIPTKALLRVSELRHTLGRLGDFGISVGEVSVDIEKVVAYSRGVADQLSRGVAYLMKKNGVAVIQGYARLAGPGALDVTKEGGVAETVRAAHIILATGARARVLPGLEPDGDTIWTYKEAMVPPAQPASLLVIGAGAIGMEFASFYADLGSAVTVVEVLPRVLPVEDEEISAAACKAFEAQGMTIHTGARVNSLTVENGAVQAAIETEDGKAEEVTFDRAILAAGIVGNVEDLGLEGTGVVVEKGHIQTDPWMATGEPGVYAIGDVTGPPWLAHKASHEGVLCVEKIAGVDGVHPLDTSKVPACTYCRPQVASVGLTEAAAKERGHAVRVGRFPFIGNGKAIALGEPEGMVKTVFDEATGELLGAHMIGTEVTELIQGYTVARTLESTEAELVGTIFPHPTLSEAMHESVLDAYGRVLHI